MFKGLCRKYLFTVLTLQYKGGHENVENMANRQGMDGQGLQFSMEVRYFLFSIPVWKGPGDYPFSCTMSSGVHSQG